MAGKIDFYYNPQSRAAVTRWALEEAGADYEIKQVRFGEGEGIDSRSDEFLAINPMGKIPTLVLDDGTVLTENGAIIAWLADAYPDAGLAPPPGSPERGTMYRWLFFMGSCFEPAMTDRMMRPDSTINPRSLGWGDYDHVVDTLEKALAQGPWLLGDNFSAADIYVAASLGWAGMFGAPRIKESQVIQDYVARASARPAAQRANGA
ncbi:glutathione S-transferase [Sphingomonas zeicaulis]|uniref:glutathione S-transferase family protein n=1 Tax=Sphingomonas zeicaulis TaxID=1632740 RepID=UPI003D1E20A6